MTQASERVVRVGCAGLPPGTSREDYFKRLPVLEAEGLGRPALLKKWRRAGAHTVLLRLERLDLDPPAWKRVLDGVEVLGAEALVLQTQTGFSPSAANRDALKRFVGDVVGDLGPLVLGWEPRGAWEPQTATHLASELGLVHVYDPLLPSLLGDRQSLPTPAPDAYYRLYGLGLQRNRFSDDQLAQLAERVGLHARVWLMFANVERWNDAQRFRAHWAASAEDVE